MRRLLPSIVLILGVGGMMNTAFGFDVQGHRGARGLAPENTLASFAQALSIGVSTLELDVVTTRDGVVVVSHNPKLEPALVRNSDGVWLDETGPAIRSLSLKQLKTYDVGRLKPGTSYAAKYPDQVAVDGMTIPTLAELLTLIRRSGNDVVRLNIETKLQPSDTDLSMTPDDFVRAVLKVVDNHGFSDRITIQSFDWRTLRVVQRVAPNIPTSYLSVQQNGYDNIGVGQPGASQWTAGYDVDDFDGSVPRMVKAAGGNIWSAYHHDVSVEKIKLAHQLGLMVKVWTVNDVDRMDVLINMGVDGIITDYPDRLRGVLKRLGTPIPQPTPVTF